MTLYYRFFFALLLSIFVFIPGVTLAAEGSEAEVLTVATDSTISLQTLGVEKTGLLPTNPFYFFKEWKRGIQRFFTFNKTKKTVLELDIANQKAAELKSLEEIQPDNTEAIQKALRNYEEAVLRLKERLQNLQKTNDTKTFDDFLSSLTEKTLKHQQLLEELSEKFEDAQETIEEIQKTLDDVILEVPKHLNDADSFRKKVSQVFEGDSSDGVSESRMLTTINRLEDKADTLFGGVLIEVRNELTQSIEAQGDAVSIQQKTEISSDSSTQVSHQEFYENGTGSESKSESSSTTKNVSTEKTVVEHNDEPVVDIDETETSLIKIENGVMTEVESTNGTRSFIVTVSGEGFSPQNLTIEKGDTVTFVNKNTISVWPASDSHPTHTEYSEFDPKSSIIPGAMWSFTFTRTGIFEYHDHLNPAKVGVITVVE
ncbi:MAG: hypothetical protein A3H06_01545 [Candidatus Colwellbacteria bacterium RIFCSPLOWO2_12_FULL_44_13]|uniref:DUF5667 domain-containing protein n=3 Tax=Candidatus Colwelliibacteriota TaxID=1817904 RepID=A0A1G1Z787_9BACT|nr:MAG: hypothetical protein A3F24_02540 [Candidatus Colwellbacteria bacterium RIFCSPHIGHO2_12_FULL_44_17]OGY60502.1 MAG: hypothetical protein A3I31_01735 [Candidatus Colwellbacteria bacterium RIFCSPLOWO2_02_FULL_44_20b]OGY61654.1 MAG: hypothetical protein A3H06_01545 [Candidatus Colwellbacteria bacterium RIFCSPLOWO2_12_FULL_44_13]